MQDLRITLAQTPLHWHNPEANARLFLREIDFPQTDLIVLPEMFSTGFSMHTDLAEEAGALAQQICKELAARTGAAVCGSTMFRAEDGTAKNRLIFQKPGEEALFYDKRHLFSLANEEKHYSAGTAKLLVEWKGWKILPLICYDLRFPAWSRRTAEHNYDLLLYAANWPERRSLAWRTLAKARAVENQTYTAVANRVGRDGNDMVYAGDSMVIDYGGRVTAKGKPFTQQLVTAVLSAEKQASFREKLPFFDDGDAFRITT